jgi:hypothetical protein
MNLMEESGRDGALRRPRRVQRRKSIGESFFMELVPPALRAGTPQRGVLTKASLLSVKGTSPQHNRKAKGI